MQDLSQIPDLSENLTEEQKEQVEQSLLNGIAKYLWKNNVITLSQYQNTCKGINNLKKFKT